MYEGDVKEQTLWWHTVLHTVGSFLLFVPALFISGLVVQVVDVINEGYIGQTGEGIGFIMRGVQYALTSYFCIALPHLILKRSHVIVTVTIFATVFGLLVLVMFLFQFTAYATDLGFYGWLEFLASGVGVIAGAIAYVFKDN